MSAARRADLAIGAPEATVGGRAEAGDAFGSAVASADLNKDGYADLLVGAPGEDVDGDTNGGTVVAIWGSPSGHGSCSPTTPVTVGPS